MASALLIFLLTMIGFVSFALYDTATIPGYAFVDAVFPITIASASLLCGLVLLVQMRLRRVRCPVRGSRDRWRDADNRFALWPTYLVRGTASATSILGFLALCGFLLAFFRLRAGLAWARSLVLTGIGIAFMCFMARLLNRDFPPGLLQHFFDLPWPLT